MPRRNFGLARVDSGLQIFRPGERAELQIASCAYGTLEERSRLQPNVADSNHGAHFVSLKLIDSEPMLQAFCRFLPRRPACHPSLSPTWQERPTVSMPALTESNHPGNPA